jgi:hypothetical protein
MRYLIAFRVEYEVVLDKADFENGVDAEYISNHFGIRLVQNLANPEKIEQTQYSINVNSILERLN